MKQLIGLNAKLAVLSDLVSGYGENFFSARVLLWGLTFCKNVGVEGFVNVRSISRFCECDLL